MKIVIVAVVLASLLAVVIHLAGRRAKGSGQEESSYTREETPEVEAFYTPYSEFMETTPPELDRFVGVLARETGLERNRVSYPISAEMLEAAATAFSTAALQVFGPKLSLESQDSEQLDRFANKHLIDGGLRPFFTGSTMSEGLSEEEEEEFGDLYDSSRIPNEPLLYYSMGAFWGEWLIRHRQAAWRLVAPLRPIQSFPDMVTTANTVCIHPFSQVVKKFSDPAGDQLAFKATASSGMKRQFPPFPLTASISDSDYAATYGFPTLFSRGWSHAKSGDNSQALAIYKEFFQAEVSDPQFYFLAIPTAWEEQQWQIVEQWSLRGLELSPKHPVLNHNLAVLYSDIPDAVPDAIEMLRLAIAEDPSYGRARITLASILHDGGNSSDAFELLDWVVENDYQLREEASSLKKVVEGNDA